MLVLRLPKGSSFIFVAVSAPHRAFSKFCFPSFFGPPPYAMGNLCQRVIMVYFKIVPRATVNTRAMLVQPC